jgi:hypothetical protein
MRERIKLVFERPARGGKVMPMSPKPFIGSVGIADGLMHDTEFELAASKIAANPLEKLVAPLVQIDRFRKFVWIEHRTTFEARTSTDRQFR